MKNFSILFFAFLTSTIAFKTAKAQVKIGSNPTQIDSTALLELESNSQGILLPRLTATERNAIAGAASGLLVFVTTDSSFYFNAGTPSNPNWTKISDQNVPNWQLNGNANLSGLPTIGTKNDAGVAIKTNDLNRIIIDSSGFITLGHQGQLQSGFYGKPRVMITDTTPDLSGNVNPANLLVYSRKGSATNPVSFNQGSIRQANGQGEEDLNSVFLTGVTGSFIDVTGILNMVLVGVETEDFSETPFTQNIDQVIGIRNDIRIAEKDASTGTIDRMVGIDVSVGNGDDETNNGNVIKATGITLNGVYAFGNDPNQNHEAAGIYISGEIQARGGSDNKSYGIKIDDMYGQNSENFSIKTGRGKVSLGDSLIIQPADIHNGAHISVRDFHLQPIPLSIKTQFMGINTPSTPISTNDVNGSFGAAIVIVDSSFNINENHHTIIVKNNAPFPTALTLPLAIHSERRIYSIVNQSSSNVNITNYIDYDGSIGSLISPQSAIKLHSDGIDWYRIP